MSLFEETLNILKKHNIRLKKGFSQNFLIDEVVKNNIISELNLKKEDTIFEIGGGIGLLSSEIAPIVKRLISCEIDPHLIPALLENVKDFKNVEVIEGDVLKIDFSKVLKEKAKVFASLPYHITTPIILHLLRFRKYISYSFLILQYEVSKRLIANPGKDYGLLSILLQIYTRPEIIMKISPSSFIPKPKPYSSLIKLNFLEKPLIAASPYFFKIAKTLYFSRRKKIINSLLKLSLSKEGILSLLEKAGLDPNSRPEELTIFDIERLTLEYIKIFLPKGF